MADLIPNIAKGKIAYYGGLPGTNDALIGTPIETTGIESDAILKDYDTLSAILAGTSNEQTTMGRKTLTTVTVTVDDTNDRVDVDAADFAWTGATGNAVSAIIVSYDPDTTAGTDADLIPLAKYDFTATPSGSDITAQVNAGGLVRAS